MSDRRAPDWLTQWEYAHRGWHNSEVPENSIAGAKGAIAAGLGIECDIQMSGDGVPMVFHDWDLKRLVGAQGQFEDWRSVELREMSLLGTEQSPATLTQFLDEIAARVPLLVEVKSHPKMTIEPVCEAIAAVLSAYTGQFAVMSFDPRITQWFRDKVPQIASGLVMREDNYGNTQTQAERDAAFATAQPDFLAYHIAALPSAWVAGLRADGLPILTWTVNTPQTRALALQCTDALIVEAEGFA